MNLIAGKAAGWVAAHTLGPGVVAGMSTRQGGVSQPPFDAWNLRPWQLPAAPADDPACVIENHRRLQAILGGEPVWLQQVHGSDCIRLRAEASRPGTGAGDGAHPVADASLTTEPGLVCAVLVADCLPVLFAAGSGRARAVAAAHAGWRGLAGGVLERTVAELCEAAGCGPAELRAWMGACIGAQAFEVGAEVLDAFGAVAKAAGAQTRPGGESTSAGSEPATGVQGCFRWSPRPDGSARWRADLRTLARLRLQSIGLRPAAIGGLEACTFSEPSRFFSYRRDGLTGRMAACIRLAGPGEP